MPQPRLLPGRSRAVLLGRRLPLLQGPPEQLRCGALTPKQSALSTLGQCLRPSALCGVLWLPCQGPFTGRSQLQKAVCPGSGRQVLGGQLHPQAPGAGSLLVVSLCRRWGRVPRAPGNSRGFCLVVASLPPRLLSSHVSLSPRVPMETPVTSREGPTPPQNDTVFYSDTNHLHFPLTLM